MSSSRKRSLDEIVEDDDEKDLNEPSNKRQKVESESENDSEWNEDGDGWGDLDIEEMPSIDMNKYSEMDAIRAEVERQEREEEEKRQRERECDCPQQHLPYISCARMKEYVEDKSDIYALIKTYKVKRTEAENAIGLLRSRDCRQHSFILESIDTYLSILNTLTWCGAFRRREVDDEEHQKLHSEMGQMINNFANGLKEWLDRAEPANWILTELKHRQTLISYTRTAQKYNKNLLDYFAHLNF